jgi:hypothetical protein
MVIIYSHPSSYMSGSANSLKSLTIKAATFIKKTQEHVLQGLNPGGVYQAIWCRDASYILKDWFLSGNLQGVMQQIYLIWSHQILPDKEKVFMEEDPRRWIFYRK